MIIPITLNGNPIKSETQETCLKSEFRVLLVYPNLPLMLVPPLAIGLFTKILKDQQYQVQLFDTTGYLSDESISPENRVKFLQAREFKYEQDLGVKIKYDLLKDFEEHVNMFKPHVLLFSVVEDAFIKTIKMLKSIEYLNIPHLLGGVFPTAAPKRCFDFPEVKAIGIGEGEKTILAFCEATRTKQPLNTVGGIWYKNNGEIIKTQANELVNINNSRPDFSLIDEARFYRPMGGKIFKTVPIETYRGCPYLCTFCNSPMQVTNAKEQEQGFFLRRKDIPILKEELKNITKLYKPEFFYFIDDSFLARPKQEIYEFCEMYKEFSLPFWFNSRPEACEPEILEALKESGCYRISFGIECGNEQYRKKVLKRYVSNDKLVSTFNNIISLSGIPFSVNLIIGFPGETRELIMDTIYLVKQINGYDTLTVSMFTPYHGTELRSVAEKNKWMDASAITIHTTSSSMLKMPKPYISSKDLDGLMKVLPLYCYFPESEWTTIKKAEKDNKKGQEILKHYSEIYNTEFLKSNQEEKIIQGGSGCKSNPKDSLKINISKLTLEEIAMLTV